MSGPRLQGVQQVCRQGGDGGVQRLQQGEEVCSTAAARQPSGLATPSLVLVLGLVS